MANFNYVVYCRIDGIDSLRNRTLANAISILRTVANDQLRASIPGSQTHSSVYGRFAVVPRHAEMAKDIATGTLRTCADFGVALAIGISSGDSEGWHDLRSDNLAGAAINTAARLAFLPGSVGRIAIDEKVYRALVASQVSDHFDGPHHGAVKKTSLTYHWIGEPIHSDAEIGHDDSIHPTSATDHIVVYDIAGYSELPRDGMIRLAEQLTKVVETSLADVGRSSKSNDLWYQPAGDGGVIVFRSNADGARRVPLNFARHLLVSAERSQIPIRIGLHEGEVTVLENELPVGIGILQTDHLSTLSPSGGLCISNDFWNELSEFDQEDLTQQFGSKLALREAPRKFPELAPQLKDATAIRSLSQGSSQIPYSQLCDLILNAELKSHLGLDLLNGEQFNNDVQNEGVILIKPGGTFCRPCVEEVVRRIYEYCRVHQVRLYSGQQIHDFGLFDDQYRPPHMIANGELPLTPADYESIRLIYDVPEFESTFGVKYDDSLVEPALVLCDRLKWTPGEMTEAWDQGRSEHLFWNHQYDGLNKIGYQKTVFPIPIFNGARPDVRLVLNGYIPGYRTLFTASTARTIAFQVSTEVPWQVIRDDVVGGSSNPEKCRPNSIRYDAYHRKIKLAPGDDVVNGQRNVCHSSATLLDGMNELMIWFGLPPDQTVVGRICKKHSIPAEEVIRYIHGQLWEASWWQRNQSIDALMWEVRRPRVTDENSGPHRRAINEIYASVAKLSPGQAQLITEVPSHAVVNNAARLELAGFDYYAYRSRKVLRDEADQDLLLIFNEITRDLERLMPTVTCVHQPAVLAEAVRIAVSDLRLLALPVYQNAVAFPQLFRSQVIAELPLQSLQCAIRTEQNFVRDIQAIATDASPLNKPVRLSDTPEWHDFTAHRPLIAIESGSDCLGLILSGGRSTRIGSTVPKPLLPFRGQLLLDVMRKKLALALEGRGATLFTAVGYRQGLLRRAFGDAVKYLDYDKTLGVGFRVATCLHDLRHYQGPVVLAYVDTPLLPVAPIRSLLQDVMNADKPQQTFGLLVAAGSSHASGHVVRGSDGCIIGIQQERTQRQAIRTSQDRDAGLYVFYNTKSFRDLLLDTMNDNVRGEYVFADVVAHLVQSSWSIVERKVRPEEAIGINTASELMTAVTGLHREASVGAAGIRDIIHKEFGIDLDPSLDNATDLKALIRNHYGPLYFFPGWEREWT